MDAVILFIGVIVGALITWLQQERMFDRQRKWELDNQRREWQRDELQDLLDKFRGTTAFVLEKVKAHTTDLDQEAYQTLMREWAGHEVTVGIGDAALGELRNEWVAALKNLMISRNDDEQRNVARVEFRRSYRKTERRIRELIKGTFYA